MAGHVNGASVAAVPACTWLATSTARAASRSSSSVIRLLQWSGENRPLLQGYYLPHDTVGRHSRIFPSAVSVQKWLAREKLAWVFFFLFNPPPPSPILASSKVGPARTFFWPSHTPYGMHIIRRFRLPGILVLDKMMSVSGVGAGAGGDMTITGGSGMTFFFSP